MQSASAKNKGGENLGRAGQRLAAANAVGAGEALTLDFGGVDEPGKLPVDLDWLIAGRAMVQATSRAGKSWLARFVLEQTHGRVQHLVVDPEGEYASLRENFDYLLISAETEAADLTARVEAAPALCRGVMEAGVSVILDLYDMKLDERRAFVGAFLGELMSLGREYWRPLLAVIDEAHRFAPQDGAVASSEAVAELTSQGGKRAFGCLLLTQRLSKLDKDVAADLQNVFIGRTQLDVDVRRAADNLGFSKGRYRELRGLSPGRFFAYGPAFPSAEVVRVKSGPVATTHPEAGKVAAAPPPAPASLKAVIAELGAALASPEKAGEPGPTAHGGHRDASGTRPDGASRIADEQDQDGLRRKVGKLERRIKTLERSNADLRERNGALVEEARSLRRGMSAGRERIGTLLGEATEALEALGDAPQVPGGSDPAAPSSARSDVPEAGKPESPPSGGISSAASADDGGLAGDGDRENKEGAVTPEVPTSKGAARILETLADLEGIGMTEVPRPALAVLSGFKNHRSGTFGRYVGELRTEGAVGYPVDGSVSLTEEGRSRTTGSGLPSGYSGNVRTLAELHERWLSRLDAGTRRIVDQLVPLYPDGLSREELATRAGFENSRSGTFGRYVGVLKKVGFVHYPERGSVAMTPALFPEGLPEGLPDREFGDRA